MIQRPHNQLSIQWLFPCLVGLVLATSSRIAIAQTEFVSQTPVTAICATPDGQLVSGSDSGLLLHDGKSLKRTKRVLSEIEKVYSIALAPAGKLIAVAGGSPAELGVVEVFSVPDFQLIRRFERFDDVATDVAWNSNDQLTACSTTGNSCLMNLSKPKPEPFNVHSKSILAIAVLPGGEMASAGKDNSIRVWRSENPRQTRVLNNHVDIVNDIAVRPSGNKDAGLAMLVSVSDDATARFWQPTIGRMVRFARLESIPTAVTWTHDGSIAIVGCRDGSIRLIDPADAKQTLALAGTGNWINDLALAADSHSLFVADENGIQRVELGLGNR